jgi:hypothetical protein
MFYASTRVRLDSCARENVHDLYTNACANRVFYEFHGNINMFGVHVTDRVDFFYHVHRLFVDSNLHKSNFG